MERFFYFYTILYIVPLMNELIPGARHTPSSNSSRNLTVSQALNYFEKSLARPNNYLRIVRRYLEYCLAESYSIDEISFHLYTSGQRPSLVSPVRKFVRFAREHGITEVLPDPAKKEIPPAANELVLGFIEDAKELNEESKATYTKALNAFFFFLEEQDLNFSGRSAGLFVSRMKQQQLSPFTINTRLSAIKQLAGWVIGNRHRLPIELESGQLDALRDVSHVKGPRMDKFFHKDGLEEDARSLLLSVVADVKWKAILSLMAYCGLRTIEVTRLKVKDVDFQQNKVFVLGKGKHLKIPVKLFVSCREMVLAYLQEHPQLEKKDFLFPGLKTSHIRYHTKKYLQLASLKTDKVSAHSLRHTTGQVLLKNGVPSIHVQRQLRHEAFASTQIYIKQQSERDFFTQMPDEG